MAFGTSVAQAIFFIASVVVALGVVTIMSFSVASLSNSASEKAKSLSKEISAGITIASDPCFIGGGSSLYVKNTGLQPLSADLVDVYVDGIPYRATSIQILKNGAWSSYNQSTLWERYDLVNITISEMFPPGTHQVRVVSENGVSDSIEYSTSVC